MEMIGRNYKVRLTGQTPLLLHKDNIQWGERVKAFCKNPANKSKSVAGDDRSPAWTWLGYCYNGSGLVVIDSDNLMAMLRDAGKKCPAATGKGTLKAQTQSGIIVNEIGWPIQVDGGRTVDYDALMNLKDEEDFEKHEAAVQKAGFELFVKRAKIGSSKHVRVRPRFELWSAEGTILVVDDTLTTKVLENLFIVAGRFVGVGDWRPGSMASGRFGQFTAEISEG
jgi:hypothetical protein